ncbi:SDR family oxidoreductase [Salinisphaera sp. T31B1]|uniref:SDR family oxidoreductase n=1 Tax=Salinisphaera sp. T31B1 TaxID=727963 RepID=UPI003341F689
MSEPVLLITGASSGIGAATARHAAEQGYRVVLAARSADKLDALVDELGGADKALAVSCNVTDKASQEQMVSATLEHFGQLDAVFANAGIGGTPGGFCGADSDVWKDMILTNVYGVGLTIQAAAEALKASRGHLLITGSAAGRATIAGSMYSATKWAVSAIGYGVREELRGTGVRVTLIEPGMVDTPFFDERPEHALADHDIAEAVLFALTRPAGVDLNEILVRPTPAIED